MLEPIALRRSTSGPWGPILVAATDRGIVAATWWTTERAFDAGLERRLGGSVASSTDMPREDPRQAFLDHACEALEALFARRPAPVRSAFDLADRPAWDRDVLAAVAAIPWGETASYGDIARRVGASGAARAVGGAVGRNPISLLIPCHRVIAADGTLGGYGGDEWGSRIAALERKQQLLALEGLDVRVRERRPGR